MRRRGWERQGPSGDGVPYSFKAPAVSPVMK